MLFGAKFHAQLDILGSVAHQAQTLACFVTKIDVIVGVGVQGCCNPEPIANLVEVGFDRRRRRNAARKGGLQHRARAYDVTVDRLRDATHGLQQQMFRHGRHRTAACRVRQDAERDRKCNDEHHVGDDQYQTQGQGLEKSDWHGE